MSPIEEFQTRFGREWAEIIGQPGFAAALAVANAEKIQKIALLTDEEIAQNATIILSDLRGHLQYEAALIGLHEKKDFVFQQLGPEEYPDPISEAADEARIEGSHVVSESGSTKTRRFKGPNVHEALFPEPKRKPRGRPPNRKKKK